MYLEIFKHVKKIVEWIYEHDSNPKDDLCMDEVRKPSV